MGAAGLTALWTNIIGFEAWGTHWGLRYELLLANVRETAAWTLILIRTLMNKSMPRHRSSLVSAPESVCSSTSPVQPHIPAYRGAKLF